MEENTINKAIRLSEIRKEIAWISGEYARMFPTDPTDLEMVADNDKFYCSVLYNLLRSLKTEIEEQKYEIHLIDKVIIAKLQIKLIRCETKDLHKMDKEEERAYKSLKMD